MQHPTGFDSPGENLLLTRLADIVGPGHVLTEPIDLAPFTIDWTGRYRGNGRIVVQPGSASEVAAIVLLCREMRMPIVPQGGNTGLVGGSVPMNGEVVVSTRRLSRIGDVDVAARQVTVGAGALLTDVQQAAQAHALQYPVDFGARDSATIGGTIATNAGGISVLRHGMTRRHVAGIEAVLGTGETVSHLGGLVKDNTGYDLTGLLCGSEGTLGIVTAARLQLAPLRTRRSTALVGFVDAAAAMSAVAGICSTRDDIDAIEFFLDTGTSLVAEAFGRTPPFAAPVYLLVESSSNDERSCSLDSEFDSRPGVVDAAVAASEAMRANLWRLREDHTPAINSLGPPLKFDVTVPVGELPPFLESVQRATSRVAQSARVVLFGHAADGNVHVNVVGVDPQSSSAVEIEDVVMAEVVVHGGSVSAEHGIGTAKKRFLVLSRSPEEIAAMKAIKRALDPDGIMNPQAIFD